MSVAARTLGLLVGCALLVACTPGTTAQCPPDSNLCGYDQPPSPGSPDDAADAAVD